jgi:hypothetical protein
VSLLAINRVAGRAQVVTGKFDVSERALTSEIGSKRKSRPCGEMSALSGQLTSPPVKTVVPMLCPIE